MAKVRAQGTKVFVESATPDTWNQVGEVTGLDGPGGQAAVINTSNLGSTAVEKMMGLPDNGQLTINANFDPSDADGQERLYTLWEGQERGNFYIEWADSAPTRWQFNGYVLGGPPSVAVDTIVTAVFTIEVDGAVNRAFTPPP